MTLEELAGRSGGVKLGRGKARGNRRRGEGWEEEEERMDGVEEE